jgi:hypothetical protein
VKYPRKEYVAFLMERYGTNDKTEVEIEEFLTEIMGRQTECCIFDFLDSCYGMYRQFKPTNEIGGCTCGAKFYTMDEAHEHECPLDETTGQ